MRFDLERHDAAVGRKRPCHRDRRVAAERAHLDHVLRPRRQQRDAQERRLLGRDVDLRQAGLK